MCGREYDMDLRKFYLENVSEQEYYYNFYDLVKRVNETYNIFEGIQEAYEYKFLVDNIDDAIEKFKYLCQPECSSDIVKHRVDINVECYH